MDFSEALNINTSEIEKPPLPPLGHYVFQVAKIVLGSIESKKTGDKWDTVEFQLQGVDATQDVDPVSLEQFGGAKMVRVTNRFMFPKGDKPEDEANFKRTLFNCKRFLTEHLGMDVGDDMPLKQAIDSSKGMQCVGSIQYRPNPDNPEEIYAELGRTAPLMS